MKKKVGLVFYDRVGWGVERGFVEKLEGLNFPWERLKVGGGMRVEVALVGVEEIRRVNREYRGKDEVTDVISVEYGEGEVLGEILVCPDYAGRGKREVGEMIIHGVLHICGFDHESENDWVLMWDLEKDLRREFGLLL